MHKRTFSKKGIALLVSLVLVLTVTVGTTLAFLIDTTDPVVNNFTPSKVTVTVNEDFDGEVKKNVSITNTGDTPAYIRAAVIITWQDENGNVYGKAPVAGTDYTVFTPAAGWKLHEGFYYWNASVDPNGNTGILIDEIKPVAGKAPDSYFLCVEIVASGVQSIGVNGANESAVIDAWGVDPTSLGLGGAG